MSTPSRSVGFIGLGKRGFGMACNLLEIGAECQSVMVRVVSGAHVDAPPTAGCCAPWRAPSCERSIRPPRGSNEVLRYSLEP